MIEKKKIETHKNDSPKIHPQRLANSTAPWTCIFKGLPLSGFRLRRKRKQTDS